MYSLRIVEKEVTHNYELGKYYAKIPKCESTKDSSDAIKSGFKVSNTFKRYFMILHKGSINDFSETCEALKNTVNDVDNVFSLISAEDGTIYPIKYGQKSYIVDDRGNTYERL